MTECIPLAYPGGGGVWGVQTPPKFRSFEKAEPNSQFRGIYICNNLIRKRVSLIYKLSETPNLGATAPRSPFRLPSVLSWICWTPPEKNPGYATGCYRCVFHRTGILLSFFKTSEFRRGLNPPKPPPWVRQWCPRCFAAAKVQYQTCIS
jgi:hypothetical protein